MRMRGCLLSVVCAFLGILVADPVILAQDRSQTRSMVISRYGIVAAESPLARKPACASSSVAETPWTPPLPRTQ